MHIPPELFIVLNATHIDIDVSCIPALGFNNPGSCANFPNVFRNISHLVRTRLLFFA
ncbi:hypothetical protein BT69DRAFT_524893 [Atractiella rhizophila]|nr:hypothetical protein BT69DRAFT_524893 [Atractiella rhizophila]